MYLIINLVRANVVRARNANGGGGVQFAGEEEVVIGQAAAIARDSPRSVALLCRKGEGTPRTMLQLLLEVHRVFGDTIDERPNPPPVVRGMISEISENSEGERCRGMGRSKDGERASGWGPLPPAFA
jgi:hypothetical protein